MTTSKPTALITGASLGIGEALAHRFAQGGHNLVLVARDATRLESLALALADQHGVRVWVAPADLSQPEAAQRLAADLKRSRRPIDVLVNNAGMLAHGLFVEMPAAQQQALIDLNISGLTAMLSAFVPAMVKRGRGRVLNVASIAAFQPVPKLATYAATKAFVLSLTESLSEELKGTGVSITALCPGITATAMLSSAQQASSELTQLPGFLIGSAETVAEQAYAACMQGDVICVPGAVNRATTLATRAAPKWLVRRLGGALVRRMK